MFGSSRRVVLFEALSKRKDIPENGLGRFIGIQSIWDPSISLESSRKGHGSPHSFAEALEVALETLLDDCAGHPLSQDQAATEQLV